MSYPLTLTNKRGNTMKILFWALGTSKSDNSKCSVSYAFAEMPSEIILRYKQIFDFAQSSQDLEEVTFPGSTASILDMSMNAEQSAHMTQEDFEDFALQGMGLSDEQITELYEHGFVFLPQTFELKRTDSSASNFTVVVDEDGFQLKLSDPALYSPSIDRWLDV